MIEKESMTITIESEEITPEDYFEYVKGKKHEVTLEELQKFRENAIYLLSKYRITNQIAGMKKLMFIINTIEKEQSVLEKGINQFVYKEDIEDFIKNVSSKAVKIIELENYPREIPDDIVEKFEAVKDLFDRFYVVFTDYTGEVERQVEKSRRDKDPILFGSFHNPENQTLYEKFYYIGDWIDEYCDLTLDKMISEMKEEGRDISHSLTIPETLDQLREELDSYVYKRGEYVKETKKPETLSIYSTNVTKKSGGILKRVKEWFLE